MTHPWHMETRCFVNLCNTDGGQRFDVSYHICSNHAPLTRGLNICTEKLPQFSIQMTASRGHGIAYEISVKASPEIIAVHLKKYHLSFG